MKTHAVLCLVLATFSCSADWQAELCRRKELMSKDVYALLQSQYESFNNNQAPKSADPAIKNIPIFESNEPLIDINGNNCSRIKMLPMPEAPFASPDCNSGFAAASKIRKTVYAKLLMMVDNLDALAAEFGYKPGQISMMVFEGLRSITTQATLFNNKTQEIRQANPTMSDDEVFKETSKWVSPVVNNVPFHTTGGAIDIRLWDNERNQFIDLGPFGAIWGKNPSAPTFSADATDEQKNNRLYLLIAAAEAGLVNYVYEYWHFSSGDRYASYWLDEQTDRQAIYGGINE